MTPHLQTRRVTLHHGDCREVLAQLPDASVDAVVTDPPYELGFMGKAWDASGVAYDLATWSAVLRVLKPGGHLLAFGGTRTYHRLACAIEDAGFEIRDSIHWLYGSGFPKSLDVSKAIDKAAGAQREVVGSGKYADRRPRAGDGVTIRMPAGDPITAPATPEAEQWQGWGTALKPAHEPVVVARKPLEGTVAANVLAHGTGALNIDGCRVGTAGGGTHCGNRDKDGRCLGHDAANGSLGGGVMRHGTDSNAGRWPANVVLDGEAAAELDRQSGDDETGVSRFFFRADLTDDDLTSFRYVAKPDRAERDAGLGDLEPVRAGSYDGNADHGGARKIGADPSAPVAPAANFHPTVKPLDLMRWLVRLVTPPGGVVLDPFAGSGTTLAAAVLEDRRAVGVELTEDYLPIIAGRVAWAEREARFGAVQGPTQVRKETPGAVSLFDEVDK